MLKPSYRMNGNCAHFYKSLKKKRTLVTSGTQKENKNGTKSLEFHLEHERDNSLLLLLKRKKIVCQFKLFLSNMECFLFVGFMFRKSWSLNERMGPELFPLLPHFTCLDSLSHSPTPPYITNREIASSQTESHKQLAAQVTGSTGIFPLLPARCIP
ncbi:hypothetical protein CEXT_203271 [Caerostris extrusa]|uniref:Uncharacterized protein n=1 Tax=Caerostris extrusa TaxID=172846 RepID=A0AAV4QVR6_CAEEX|nr:hypothetical protein CEXT_203271 [Caerostris extrusa]